MVCLFRGSEYPVVYKNQNGPVRTFTFLPRAAP